MLKWLFKLRYLALIVAICSALHSIAFIVIGVIRGVEGYRLIFRGSPLSGEDSPGIFIGKSIDAFLLAMVFFVFSIGMIVLFAAPKSSEALDEIPAWMRVKNLSELKFIIWEAILVAMVVASIEALVVASQDLRWTALIVPIALLILAAGLFLAKKGH